MKVLFILSFSIGFFIFNSILVWADENHNHDSQYEENYVEDQDVSGQHNDDPILQDDTPSTNEVEKDGHHSEMTEEEHQDSLSHEISENEVAPKEEGHDAHGNTDYIEKPANIMVLGTYGAINISFILFGIWNKWFRRQEA